jgi:hypothetical protein
MIPGENHKHWVLSSGHFQTVKDRRCKRIKNSARRLKVISTLNIVLSVPIPQRSSMNRLRTSLALIFVLLSLIACGSSSQAVINRETAVVTQSAGNPTVKVWVNTNSGVYHCPGTRWYGNTKSGQYITQREAQSKGYRPAYGSVCG